MMTRDGLYIMPPGCGSPPQSVSREFLPKELLNIDTSAYAVSMAYDLRLRGAHLVPLQRIKYLSLVYRCLYQRNRRQFSASFWPVSYSAAHSPMTCHARQYTGTDSPVVYGSKDGYIKKLADGSRPR